MCCKRAANGTTANDDERARRVPHEIDESPANAASMRSPSSGLIRAKWAYGTEGQRFESSRARSENPRKSGVFVVLGEVSGPVHVLGSC